MLFNSYVFIFVFLPLTLVGFRILNLRQSSQLAIAWLVLASLFYYAWWSPVYLPLLLFSIVANFAIGMRLSSSREAGKKLVLALGVTMNLLLLGGFKYANFVADSVSAVAGHPVFDLPPIVLPLAISFFTFQQVAYLVDARRGLTREYRFIDYCLFVTFFPQLIAGPIVHHKEMLPQFEQHKKRFGAHADLPIGFTIFAIGLFKKVVLADQVALYANPVFDGVAGGITPTTIDAWLGALAYTLQLYFDFSGYSDMAIGLGRMFGIRLPLNFNSPYKARNIIEFWRRWHITLSRFLRDYLYFPLGGNRRGPKRRYVNLMLTMLLGGLWHGAGWTFVAWGGLHGAYLAGNHLFHEMCRRVGIAPGAGGLPVRVLATGLTFMCVVVGWVLFRADSFASASVILQSMAGMTGDSLSQFNLENLKGLDTAWTFDFQHNQVRLIEMDEALPWIGTLLAIALFAPATHEIMSRHNRPFGWSPPLDAEGNEIHTLGWNPDLLGAILIVGAFVWAVGILRRPAEFLYFQF